MVLGTSLVLGLAAVALAVAGFVDSRGRISEERVARAGAVEDVVERLDALAAENEQLTDANAALGARVQELESELAAGENASANLARRVLRSVYTVVVAGGLGTGFVAWQEDGYTYVLTAAHVVEGQRVVRLRKGERGVRGVVVSRDVVNDMAVIRVDGELARPLWQDTERLDASVGDQVLIVGSPEGLEEAASETIGSAGRPSALPRLRAALVPFALSGVMRAVGQGLACRAHEGAAGEDQERIHDEVLADQLAAPEEDRGEHDRSEHARARQGRHDRHLRPVERPEQRGPRAGRVDV